MYQSATVLLVTDFTYLEGRDGELVKELAAADSQKQQGIFIYLFK
jgi:hypothetical protein